MVLVRRFIFLIWDNCGLRKSLRGPFLRALKMFKRIFLTASASRYGWIPEFAGHLAGLGEPKNLNICGVNGLNVLSC